MASFLLGIASLTVSLYVLIRLKNQSRIATANTERLYRLANEAQMAMDQIRQGLNRLELEMMRQNGTLRIHSDMTIAEALILEPGVSKVMAGFHIGGCSSCATSEHETIAEAAKSYGVDLTHLMNSIHKYMENPAAYEKEVAGHDHQHAHGHAPRPQPQLVQIGGSRG